MALPTLDATFASAADLPRLQMLAKWLVSVSRSGSIDDYWTLPEKYLYAKIAVASGAPRSEADYIHLPDRYIWSDIYKAVSGSSDNTIDRGEKEALGWIAAAIRGDANDPAKVATYINWPWRYQVASIIAELALDSDAQSFITTSGATNVEAIDQFVRGVKALGLWNSMVAWPLRSSQNAGTGTTAYSLGGLGSFNGTMVNGPTWGTNGITFDGTNDYISTGFTWPLPFTAFVSWQQLGATVSKAVIGGGIDSFTRPALAGASGGTLFRFVQQGNPLVNVLGDVVHSNTQRVYAASVSGTSGQGVWTTNGVAQSPATNAACVSTPFSNVHFAAWGTDRTNALIQMVVFFNVATTATQQSNLYSLYKSTLGAGLGLP